MSDIVAAIDRGLAYLTAQQEDDGSFSSFSSASMTAFRRRRSWQTVFVPALMLSSLAELSTPAAHQLRRRLADFLIDQKNADWSFNYWSQRAPEYKAQAYPNDLDDTFCALAGLYKHDPSLVDEAAMVHIIKLLLAAETSVGGPYRTWLVSKDSQPIWLDVDVAVNSNIAYFLSLAGHDLPKLSAFIGQAIKDETYVSPYYPSKYAFVYYFARSYHGPYQKQLLVQIRKLRQAADNDLNRALCLSASLRLGDKQGLETEVRSLLNGQRRDGSWPAAAFYADPVRDGRLYYNGGAALTTAFVLEALELYQPTRTVLSNKNRAPAKQRADSQPILSIAAEQCRHLEPELRDKTFALLQQQAAGSHGATIINLPRNFNRSLIQPLRPEPAELFNMLGLGNLYGWLAYTIYDDFLDEDGQPSALPPANVAMRYSLECFQQAVAEPDFQRLVRKTFDTIDGANAWEQANCRCEVEKSRLVVDSLPEYGDLRKLAERSLGHTLPPLAVLAAKKLDITDASFRQIDKGLRHYLIVRQLNDDLHDWQEDLSRGHLSYVVVRLLKELEVRPKSYEVVALSNQAQRQFWRHTLAAICRLMRTQLAKSRRAFTASGLLAPDSEMYLLLDGLESSLAGTLAQQRQTIRFLDHYKQTAQP